MLQAQAFDRTKLKALFSTKRSQNYQKNLDQTFPTPNKSSGTKPS